MKPVREKFDSRYCEMTYFRKNDILEKIVRDVLIDIYIKFFTCNGRGHLGMNQ